MNIDEKIAAWEPAAVWSAAGDGMFTVPVDGFHDLAARLKAEGFDPRIVQHLVNRLVK